MAAEQESRHLVEGRLGALSLGIHEVGAAVHALRDETRAGFAAVEERFAGVEERFAGVEERFTGVERTLAQILERLPARE